MKAFFFFIIIHMFMFNLYAQKQVLLHIDSRGQQEAISMDNNQDVSTLIKKIEMENSINRIGSLVDTIRYNLDFNTNFGFNSDSAIN